MNSLKVSLPGAREKHQEEQVASQGSKPSDENEVPRCAKSSLTSASQIDQEI